MVPSPIWPGTGSGGWCLRSLVIRLLAVPVGTAPMACWLWPDSERDLFSAAAFVSKKRYWRWFVRNLLFVLVLVMFPVHIQAFDFHGIKTGMSKDQVSEALTALAGR